MLDRCVLMVQSPAVLYCYWEISKMKMQLFEHHLNGDWQSFSKKLRVNDITEIKYNGNNSHKYLSYDLTNDTIKQFFIRGIIPNRKYCVDIGIETEEGVFISLLRSNEVNTPNTFIDNRSYEQLQKSWKNTKKNEPEWLRGYSSYSYYENLNIEGDS